MMEVWGFQSVKSYSTAYEGLQYLGEQSNDIGLVLVDGNNQDPALVAAMAARYPSLIMGTKARESIEKLYQSHISSETSPSSPLRFINKPVGLKDLYHYFIKKFQNIKNKNKNNNNNIDINSNSNSNNNNNNSLSKSDLAVLIAEDNLMNQKVLQKMVISLGYTNVDIAENGKIAVKIASEKKIDLILMDVMVSDYQSRYTSK